MGLLPLIKRFRTPSPSQRSFATKTTNQVKSFKLFLLLSTRHLSAVT